MRNKIHRRKRKKFCGEKRSYLTREDACSDMGLPAKTTGTKGLSVYRCKDGCGQFHIGHTPYKIQQRFGLES
jgi:hypothetical protein